jgi:hypothetical protein
VCCPTRFSASTLAAVSFVVQIVPAQVNAVISVTIPGCSESRTRAVNVGASAVVTLLGSVHSKLSLTETGPCVTGVCANPVRLNNSMKIVKLQAARTASPVRFAIRTHVGHTWTPSTQPSRMPRRFTVTGVAE